MELIKQAILKEKLLTVTLKRAASNFLWSIMSEAIAKAVFFVTTIYLARRLGVSNFGLFTLAQTITLYFWLAVDLGINMYGIREIAKDKKNAEKIINPLLTLRITSGLILFSLYVLSLLLFNMPVTKKLVFAGCGLYLLTYAFYTDWILKGLEGFKYIAFGSFVSSTAFLTGTIYFVKGNEDIVVASFIWSISFLLGGMSLLYFLYKKLGIKFKPSFNFSVWSSHVKESIYFMISGGLLVLYQYFPIFLLSIYFTSFTVGLFSAPYRVVITIGTAGYMIPMAFYPIFSELYYRDRIEFIKTHRNFQKIMLAIGLPVGFIGMIFGDQIVTIFFGSQYQQSVKIFKMLIWLIPLYFLRYSYGSVILATGFQRLHNIATSAGVFCMFITGILLVPKYSIIGGVVSLLISEAVILISMSLIFFIKIKKEEVLHG